MVVELRPQCLVSSFAHAVGGKVQWNGQMLVLLYGGPQPLLTVLCEVVVREEWHRKWDIWFGWSQVAVVECFVGDV